MKYTNEKTNEVKKAAARVGEPDMKVAGLSGRYRAIKLPGGRWKFEERK